MHRRSSTYLVWRRSGDLEPLRETLWGYRLHLCSLNMHLRQRVHGLAMTLGQENNQLLEEIGVQHNILRKVQQILKQAQQDNREGCKKS